MKTMTLGVGTLLTVCLVSSAAQAYSRGQVEYSGKQNPIVTCVNCHSGAPSQPSISIVGPASLSAGQTGQYEVVLTGGPAVVGGVNVAVDNGATLQIQSNSGLRVALGELTHTAPKAFSGGQVRFSFSVVAPTSGNTFKIYAAGNSANNNNNQSGDIGVSTQRDVAVTGGGVPQPDAGTPDAGAPDAGREDGGNEPGPGGTPPPPADPSPYGCAAAGGPPALLLLMAVGLLARRRRRD